MLELVWYRRASDSLEFRPRWPLDSRNSLGRDGHRGVGQRHGDESMEGRRTEDEVVVASLLSSRLQDANADTRQIDKINVLWALMTVLAACPAEDQEAGASRIAWLVAFDSTVEQSSLIDFG